MMPRIYHNEETKKRGREEEYQERGERELSFEEKETSI
jgi:hypothetical protein